MRLCEIINREASVVLSKEQLPQQLKLLAGIAALAALTNGITSPCVECERRVHGFCHDDKLPWDECWIRWSARETVKGDKR